MKAIATISALFLLLGIGAKAQNNKTPSYPLTGTWECVAHGDPNGDIPFKLHMQQDGEGISGWASAPQGSANLSSASFADNHLKMEIDTDEDQYALTATLKAGKLAGAWQRNGQQMGTWEGKKISDSETDE